MKKMLCFAAAMLLFAACSKDDEESGLPSLPDPNDVCSAMDDLKFMEYCYKNFDINGDGKVSKAEAEAVRGMEIRNYDINSLKGIAYFPNLQALFCPSQDLTSLDISKNTALTYLYCSFNELTSLDISKNTALTYLNCDDNELSSLDISKNTALTELHCSFNKLTSLDISKNTALTWLSCSGNPGDGTTFSVKAWFDNNNIPEDFETRSWEDDGKSIRISYHK